MCVVTEASYFSYIRAANDPPKRRSATVESQQGIGATLVSAEHTRTAECFETRYTTSGMI